MATETPPPRPYVLRRSARARSVRIQYSAQAGLTVTVPRDFEASRVEELLAKKSAWLEGIEARFAQQRPFLEPAAPGRLPERIVLRVIGQEWAVGYRQTASPLVTAVWRSGQRLLVYGDIENEAAVKTALSRWLSRQAQAHLVPWLWRLAREHEMPLERAWVKSQRTRWASCSARRIISLNVRLLFLPEPLVRYVMRHELAHTREMNHGRRFWALVESMDADYRRQDKALREGWRLIPAWLSGPESSGQEGSEI